MSNNYDDDQAQKVQIKEKDLESALALGDVTYKADKRDDDDHDGNGGCIPKKHQGMALLILVGFAVTFLADFCAKLAKDAYDKRTGDPSAVTTESYRLLYVSNLVHACMFIPCALMMAAPRATGLDTMFIKLFWTEESLNAPNAPGRLFERQMCFIILALGIAQLLQPSNPGVGLVCLLVNACMFFNFVAAVVFDHYKGIVNRVPMWSGFVVAPIVWIGLFTVALDRVNFFNTKANPWFNEAGTDTDDQSMLFYVTVCHGLMWLPIAIFNVIPGCDKMFMSLFFDGEVYADRTATEWVSRNVALMFTALSIACVTSPTSTGVATVCFFLNLLMAPLFCMALVGQVGQVKNKMIWVSFLVTSIVFVALFAVALNKLDFTKDECVSGPGVAMHCAKPWNVPGSN